MNSEKFAVSYEIFPFLSMLLFDHGLTVIVKMGHSIGTVTEESDADAFPVAATHGEGVAGREVDFAISAIEVLVAVLFTVVGNFKVETGVATGLDERAMAV